MSSGVFPHERCQVPFRAWGHRTGIAVERLVHNSFTDFPCANKLSDCVMIDSFNLASLLRCICMFYDALQIPHAVPCVLRGLSLWSLMVAPCEPRHTKQFLSKQRALYLCVYVCGFYVVPNRVQYIPAPK